jgi:hypothetical protein
MPGAGKPKTLAVARACAEMIGQYSPNHSSTQCTRIGLEENSSFPRQSPSNIKSANQQIDV